MDDIVVATIIFHMQPIEKPAFKLSPLTHNLIIKQMQVLSQI